MKFVKVQIPYRGGIPIINRRGPLASVELDVDAIKKLMEYGIEMLDPATGKPINLDKDDVTVSSVETSETPEEETSNADESFEKIGGDDSTEPVSPASDSEKVAETPIVNLQIPEPEKKETSDDATSTEDESDETVDGADAFDHTRIANYSALSRSKRKELRKYFAENTGKMDTNILYSNLNAMAKK